MLLALSLVLDGGTAGPFNTWETALFGVITLPALLPVAWGFRTLARQARVTGPAGTLDW